MHTRPPLKAARGRPTALSACLAQNFSSCRLSTTSTHFSSLKAQTYLQFQPQPVKFWSHTKRVDPRPVRRSRLVLCGRIHLRGMAPDLKQLEGVSLLPVPLWAVGKSTPTIGGGAQERPERPKHDWGQGRFHISHFAFNSSLRRGQLSSA